MKENNTDANIHEWYVSWANSLDSNGEDSKPAALRLSNLGTLTYMFDSMFAAIRAARHIDCVKKHVFYGRDIRDFKDYTLPHDATVPGVASRVSDHNTIRLLHSITGLFDEAGELMQALFEYIYFDVPLDQTNIEEEFGDALWYLALGARYLKEESFAFLMVSNYAKLTIRYAVGTWTQDAALNRDLKAEREALQKGGLNDNTNN